MALVLDGTNGVSGVDGTASNPSLEGTDSNTGIFYPAADTWAVATGGTEALRVNSSQNVGIGTQSPAVKLDVAGNATIQNGVLTVGKDTLYDAFINTPESMYFNVDSDGNSTNNKFVWGTDRASNTGGTTWMTLDASGNLVLGTTASLSSAANRIDLTINGTSSAMLSFGTGGTRRGYALHDGTDFTIASETAGALRFLNNGSERARITSGGSLLVGTTTDSGVLSISGNQAYFTSTSTTNASLTLRKGAAGADAIDFFQCRDSGNGAEFIIQGDGDAQNTNNSYGAISDAKLKENIVDATPKLEKLNQVRIVNFNLIGDNKKQIGVIAQELEQIFPSMVKSTPDYDAEGNDLGTTTKSVKYSVFVPMLIKAIQEQQAMIDELKAKVAALENA